MVWLLAGNPDERHPILLDNLPHTEAGHRGVGNYHFGISDQVARNIDTFIHLVLTHRRQKRHTRI